MANNTLKFVVEVAADQATGALNAISTAVNQAGIKMKSTMLGVGEASRAASVESGGLESKIKSLKTEMVQGDRTINFFANSLNGIIPASSAAGQGIRLLADGLIGGVGLGFALQATMGVLELFTSRLKEEQAAQKAAREETERHSQALGKLAYNAALSRMRASYESAGGDPTKLDRAASNMERESEIQDLRNTLLDRQAKILAEIAGYEGQINQLREMKTAGAYTSQDAMRAARLDEQTSEARERLSEINGMLEKSERALADARAAGSLAADTADKKAEERAAKRDTGGVGGRSTDPAVAQRAEFERLRRIAQARRELEVALLDMQYDGEDAEKAAAAKFNASLVKDAKDTGTEMGKGYVEPMVGSFAHGLGRMLQGQATFADALTSMWSGMLDLVTQTVSKMISGWLMASATQGVVDRAAKIEEVTRAAGVAGANAAASTAAIPLVGPALAPAAMGAMIQTVLAATLPLASARSGWDIPNIAGDIPAVLHKREMVLPEEHADTIRSLRRGGSSVTVQISAMDGDSVARVVEGRAFQQAMRRSTRRHG